MRSYKQVTFLFRSLCIRQIARVRCKCSIPKRLLTAKLVMVGSAARTCTWIAGNNCCCSSFSSFYLTLLLPIGQQYDDRPSLGGNARNTQNAQRESSPRTDLPAILLRHQRKQMERIKNMPAHKLMELHEARGERRTRSLEANPDFPLTSPSSCGFQALVGFAAANATENQPQHLRSRGAWKYAKLLGLPLRHIGVRGIGRSCSRHQRGP